MTTITAQPVDSQLHHIPAHRLWNVVRLHFTNKWTILGQPWLILGIIFLANVAIWAIIAGSVPATDAPDALEGTQFSGGTFFIFVYMLVVAAQSISATFPFALGYSVTRRNYYLGTSLTWLILAAMLAVGFTALTYLEEWTGGWWLGGHFFTAVYFGQGLVLARLLTLFAGFLFFFFVGTVSAAIYARWKVTGLLLAGALLLLVLLGLLALAGYTDSWAAVGAWIQAAGPTGIMAWSLIVTVIAAVLGYVLLLRATPRT